MQHDPRSRPLTIRDARAAAVFTQSPMRRILLQFAGAPRGVAEVAADLAIDLKKLHHAVTRLHRLGLLEVAAERPRAGRPIKLYRCVAESYLVPGDVAPAPFSQGLAKELQHAIAREVAATAQGMEFWLDAQGRVSGRLVPRRGSAAPPLDSWRILRLSASQAGRLMQALTEVLDRFQSEAAAGGQVYLVHAGMARRLDHVGATDNPAANLSPRPQSDSPSPGRHSSR